MNNTQPYRSRLIRIGKLALGGEEPIRLQSMTNTPTTDTERTVKQIIQLYEAGCELVRISARNMNEAQNLVLIRDQLEKRGIDIPLAADIHFNPSVAELAATVVHKIRINPGNYLDSQHFLSKELQIDKQEPTKEELEENIHRLIAICKTHDTAIRVGVNHGSLSDRILRKCGNTPEGMVASAMEFLNICRDADFHKLVVSMKSSHVQTMVKATEGIVEAMQIAGMDYPVHLGVTEAGEGEDGRIRSAAGIGPLLKKGIGDTIRVSLTEDPVAEIPVASILRDRYSYVRTNGLHPRDFTLDALPGKPLQFTFPDHDKDWMTIAASAELSSHILKTGEKSYRILGESGKDYQELLLGILQATGVYISNTEYISCPTCGRTSFDLQSVLKKIKEKTRGLRGIRIAVMGCIVNGPGEMAGAHYGYVGAGPGKVTLYHNGKAVMKNIPEKEAVQKLLLLISDTIGSIDESLMP